MADLAWLKAIDAVLRAAAPEALHTNDIASRIIESGLRQKAGATPGATVRSTLLTAIKKQGEASHFEKVGPGKFRLKNAHEPEQTSEVSQGTEPNSRAVTSFGIHWDRDAVEWKPQPCVLGEFQTEGAAKTKLTTVDFGGQRGLYLLHDDREVIYVGRTTKRNLGQRLYEHTRDRLQGRWNRFSWFGFLPVADNGQLGEAPESAPSGYDLEGLIGDIEAILIEALEPRQNRKRGDDLGTVEYRQVLDPGVQKNKLLKTLLDQR